MHDWFGLLSSLTTYMLLSLPFAMPAPALLALVFKLLKFRWKVTLPGHEQPRQIPYILWALLGGISGGPLAFASLLLDAWWWCRQNSSACHDGQSSLVLLFTLPLFSFLGSVLALLWLWLSLRIPADNLLSSALIYSGSHRQANRAIRTCLNALLWLLCLLLASLPMAGC